MAALVVAGCLASCRGTEFMADNAIRQLLPQMTETKRRNPLAGYIADLIAAGDQFARKPFGYNNPPAQYISDALGVPAVQQTLNRMSYGDRLTQGKGQTLQLRPEVVDAGLAVAPVAAKFPRATLGAVGMLAGAADTGAGRAMFIGANAKTWDKAAAAKAAQMDAAGTDARTIWQETGTFKGADGKWRQEVDDSGAMFNASGAGAARRENDIMQGAPGMNFGPTLGLLDHPELSAAYGRDLVPNTFIGNKNTLFGDGVQGMYDADKAAITVNAPVRATEGRSLTLHELQHGVQHREGFASGGNVGQFADIDEDSVNTARVIAARIRKGDSPSVAARWVKDRLGKDATPQIMDWAMSRDIGTMPTNAREAYLRLAGEAEARATQARMNLNAQQRRELFPFDSYDVPRDRLIVR